MQLTPQRFYTRLFVGNLCVIMPRNTGDYKDFGRYYDQNVAGVTILPPNKVLYSL